MEKLLRVTGKHPRSTEKSQLNLKILYPMKIYKTNEIKNIALLGSKGSGKTTLAESMIYECGVIKRRGTDRKSVV